MLAYYRTVEWVEMLNQKNLSFVVHGCNAEYSYANSTRYYMDRYTPLRHISSPRGMHRDIAAVLTRGASVGTEYHHLQRWDYKCCKC